MSQQIALMADEAFAQGSVPPGYSIIAGYLYSQTAYHPWTGADWAKFGTMRKLPIFVPREAGSPPVWTAPVDDAFKVGDQLYRLKVPKGNPVALDLETTVNVDYVTWFAAALRWIGYRTWVYGSASTLFGNPCPPFGGYWVADYAGKGPFMYPHAGVRATQYASGATFDSSVVAWWQYLFTLKPW